MDSLDTSSQSYIYSVVDEQRNTGRLGYSMESFSNTNLLGSIASLVTQLNNSDACKNVRLSNCCFMAVVSRTSFYGSTNNFNKILLAENGGGVVSHQVYRVIYVHLW